jgi:hypothetical protein
MSMLNEMGDLSRRQFASLGVTAAAALGGLASDAAAQSRPGIPPLKSEWLMDLIVKTDAPSMTIGPRLIVGISSGSFQGPKLKGKVVGPGGEWGASRPDGSYHIDVRFELQTDDNEMIYVAYGGVIFPFRPAEGGRREFWVNTPVFETASTKYEWLNRAVCVGVNYAVPPEVGSLAYHVYQVFS